MSAALLYAKATAAQLASARALVQLALAEEPNEATRRGLVAVDEELVFLGAVGTLVFFVRGSVETLRAGALPGGTLDVAAGAWLALHENGGAA